MEVLSVQKHYQVLLSGLQSLVDLGLQGGHIQLLAGQRMEHIHLLREELLAQTGVAYLDDQLRLHVLSTYEVHAAAVSAAGVKAAYLSAEM